MGAVQGAQVRPENSQVQALYVGRRGRPQAMGASRKDFIGGIELIF